MPVYNTIVTVIANVEAPDEKAAISRLTQAVEHAGFSTYDNYTEDTRQAFESEPGVKAETLPGQNA